MHPRVNVFVHSFLYLERKRKPMPMQYTSVISETFNGKLLSCVQCLHCHQTSEISETFQDLSLPIPNKEDLYLIHHQPQISAILTNSSASSNNPLSPSSVSRNTNPCANSYNSQGWIAWIYDWIRRFIVHASELFLHVDVQGKWLWSVFFEIGRNLKFPTMIKCENAIIVYNKAILWSL